MLFLACASVSVLTTVGIVGVLVFEAIQFFREVSVFEFLGGTEWRPLFVPKEYGVLPLVVGTLHIVVGSGLIAIPVGLASAIYLSEYASPKARGIIKPVLEVLAGIPTVVYGYFALTGITPFLQRLVGTDAAGDPLVSVYNSASASIVVGIMILPMVASLCDDALRAVPKSLRHAGSALGATRFEVSTRIVVPAALSGIAASFVLAISRAIGETMAVTLAAGGKPSITVSPFESVQTMTAFIVQAAKGDQPHGTTEYYSLYAVAVLLFSITLVTNMIAHRVLRRFREVYE